jgi:hypothetical protein
LYLLTLHFVALTVCCSVLPLFSLRLNSEMLLFALEKQPIEQQQDHGAVIETHDQTGDFKEW